MQELFTDYAIGSRPRIRCGVRFERKAVGENRYSQLRVIWILSGAHRRDFRGHAKPSEIDNFVHDFQLENVYPGVSFHASASKHPVLYNAMFQFCLIFAIFQVGILVTRFFLKESISRKSGTFSVLFFGSVLRLR